MANAQPRVYYSYDPTDFFFIGEGFADLDPIGGHPLLAAFATFLEPPSTELIGEQIAVFDPAASRWSMRPNNYWRPKILRRPVRLNHPLTGDLSIRQLSPSAFNYAGIPRVLSPAAISLGLSGRLHYLDVRAKEIWQFHLRRNEGFAPGMLHYWKILTEDLVTQMKRFLDDVFVQEWIKLEHDSSDFQRERKVRLQGFNEVDRLTAGATRDALRALRDCEADLFATIQDLRNSFAHHVAVSESYFLLGQDWPTVSTVYSKDGDLGQLELIEVYVEDLVRAFNSFVDRVFR